MRPEPDGSTGTKGYVLIGHVSSRIDNVNCRDRL